MCCLPYRRPTNPPPPKVIKILEDGVQEKEIDGNRVFSLSVGDNFIGSGTLPGSSPLYLPNFSRCGRKRKKDGLGE